MRGWCQKDGLYIPHYEPFVFCFIPITNFWSFRLQTIIFLQTKFGQFNDSKSRVDELLMVRCLHTIYTPGSYTEKNFLYMQVWCDTTILKISSALPRYHMKRLAGDRSLNIFSIKVIFLINFGIFFLPKKLKRFWKTEFFFFLLLEKKKKNTFREKHFRS